jgi:hypothetical protein
VLEGVIAGKLVVNRMETLFACLEGRKRERGRSKMVYRMTHNSLCFGVEY